MDENKTRVILAAKISVPELNFMTITYSELEFTANYYIYFEILTTYFRR